MAGTSPDHGTTLLPPGRHKSCRDTVVACIGRTKVLAAVAGASPDTSHEMCLHTFVATSTSVHPRCERSPLRQVLINPHVVVILPILLPSPSFGATDRIPLDVASIRVPAPQTQDAQTRSPKCSIPKRGGKSRRQEISVRGPAGKGSRRRTRSAPAPPPPSPR